MIETRWSVTDFSHTGLLNGCPCKWLSDPVLSVFRGMPFRHRQQNIQLFCWLYPAYAVCPFEIVPKYFFMDPKPTHTDFYFCIFPLGGGSRIFYYCFLILFCSIHWYWSFYWAEGEVMFGYVCIVSECVLCLEDVCKKKEKYYFS